MEQPERRQTAVALAYNGQDAAPRVKDAQPLDLGLLAKEAPESLDVWRRTNETIKKVTNAIGTDFHYNVGVSTMMELGNAIQALPEAEKKTPQGRAALKFATLFLPFSEMSMTSLGLRILATHNLKKCNRPPTTRLRRLT